MSDASLVTAATPSQQTQATTNNIRGVSALLYACQQGKVDKVRRILRAQPEYYLERDRTGKTALHYCCTSDHISATQAADVLVMAAPDLIESRDEDGFTPLHLAVIAGNMPLVTFLIANNADIKAVDNEKHTVVHWATVCGETVALRAVLAAGAPVSSPDVHGGYPLHYASQMCGGEKDSTLGLQVLHTLLSQQGINVSVEDGDGRRPLLWAASAGSAKAVLALIRAGSAIEAHDKDGLTALHCAASRGHTDTIDTLLTLCGASPDVIDTNGCTALHYAVTLGHADATALLLTHAADPNKQDRKGRSPAHCGCAKGQLETVKMLGNRGANLWLRNARGDLPLHEAAASGRRELVKWLLEARPSNVNARNNDGRCPLHLAALNDNADMCKILLDTGAQINPVLRTSKNVFMTPLDCALIRGFRSTAKYLQLHGGVPANRLAGFTQTTTINSAISMHIRDDVTLWGGSSSENDEPIKERSKKKPNKRKTIYKPDRKPNDEIRESDNVDLSVDALNRQGVNKEHGEIFIYANEVNINDRLGPIRVEHNREVTVSVAGEETRTPSSERQRPKSAKYGNSKKGPRINDSVTLDSSNVVVENNSEQDQLEKISNIQEIGLQNAKGANISSHIDRLSEKSTTSYDDAEGPRRLVVEASVHVPPESSKYKSSKTHDAPSNNAAPTKDSSTTTDDLILEVCEDPHRVTPMKPIESPHNSDNVTNKNVELSLENEIKADINPEEETDQKLLDTQILENPVVSEITIYPTTSSPISTGNVTILDPDTNTPSSSSPVKKVSRSPTPLEADTSEHNVSLEIGESIPPSPVPLVSLPTTNNSPSPPETIVLVTPIPEVVSETTTDANKITETSVIISPPTPESQIFSDHVSSSSPNPPHALQETPQLAQSAELNETVAETYHEEVSLQHPISPATGNKNTKSRKKAPKHEKHATEHADIIKTTKKRVSNKITAPQESSIEARSSSDEDNSRRSTPSSNLSSSNDHRSFKVLDVDNGNRPQPARQLSSKRQQRPLSEKHKIGVISKEHDRLKRSKIPTPIGVKSRLSKSDKHLDRYERKLNTEIDERVPSLPNIHDSTDMSFKHSRSMSNLSAPMISSKYSEIEGETESDRDEVSSATKKKRLRKRSKTRSAKSVVSDYESSNLIDSGFEPSPRSTRIPKWRNMSDRGVVMTSVTQTIQTNIRRYHLERKIFQHLLDLKRLQIRSGQHNESVLVKRAIDVYHRSCAATVGAGRYTSQDLTFKGFENFLYGSLRKIQRNGVEHLHGLPETPRNPLFCTQSTHRCDHATHAYTGVPCAAYLPKMDHHTIPKIGFDCKPSGFLPKIASKNAVTLELCHGNDKQLISLPAERLDQNKRYYVTFTVKGNDEASTIPVEQSDTHDSGSHVHARSD